MVSRYRVSTGAVMVPSGDPVPDRKRSSSCTMALYSATRFPRAQFHVRDAAGDPGTVTVASAAPVTVTRGPTAETVTVMS